MQAMLDIGGAIDSFNQRLREAAAALPFRQRTLLVGLDQPDIVTGLLCRQREPNGERALAAAALLRGEYDRVHRKFLRRCLGFYAKPSASLIAMREQFSLGTSQSDPCMNGDRGSPNQQHR